MIVDQYRRTRRARTGIFCIDSDLYASALRGMYRECNDTLGQWAEMVMYRRLSQSAGNRVRLFSVEPGLHGISGSTGQESVGGGTRQRTEDVRPHAQSRLDRRYCGSVGSPRRDADLFLRLHSRYGTGSLDARTIESVLDQTYPHWELVIGDNASEDDLCALVAGTTTSGFAITAGPSTPESSRITTAPCCCVGMTGFSCCAATTGCCPPAWSDWQIESRRLRARDPLAMVIGAAQRSDAAGQSADAAYYGYAGRAPIPDGEHDAPTWLRVSTFAGVTPWNFGAVAIARRVLTESGGFFRPEVGMCSDVEATIRLAAYGDVAYVDEPLLDYTVGATPTGAPAPAAIARVAIR